MPKYDIRPYAVERPNAVRGAYIYNLVDLIYQCILKRDLPRARRGWAILIRCPDVNWKERWDWALFLLNASVPAREEESGGDGPSSQYTSQAAMSQSQSREPGQETVNFLRAIRLSAKEEDKPGVLAELVLHLIAVGRYRDALDELSTYLPAYPYILSAPLHTYAGLICFYLAQPPSARQEPTDQATSATQQRSRESTDASEPYRERESTVDSDLTATSSNSRERSPPPAPDANLLRQAKGWFTEALKIDPDETVAKGFRDMIDRPTDAASDDEFDGDGDVSIEEQSPRRRELSSSMSMASVASG